MGDKLARIKSGVVEQLNLSSWLETRGTKTWHADLMRKVEVISERLPLLQRGIRKDEIQQFYDSLSNVAIDKPADVHIAESLTERIWTKEWRVEHESKSWPPVLSSIGRANLELYLTEWIKYDSMESREKAIAEPFQATYGWIYEPWTRASQSNIDEDPGLVPWMENSDSLDKHHVFWITGKPGSGKSTMMKYIVTHDQTKVALQKWAGELPLLVISYYAWKPGTKLAKSVEGLIRSVIYQMLLAHPEWAPLLCPRRWSPLCLTRTHAQPPQSPTWKDWELTECLQNILAVARNTVRLAVFIDGLDEFGDYLEPEEDLRRLCEIIRLLAENHDIKVCVASREWRQFVDAFSGCPTLAMHLMTRRDMVTYVEGQFVDLPAFVDLGLQDTDSEELFSEIVAQSEGIFLWLSLVTKTMIQELEDGATIRNIWIILGKMPKELEKLYHVIYDTIPPRIRSHSATILRIYLAAIGRDWLPLWLADEMRTVDADVGLKHLYLDIAHANMRRKLISRTRGLLELRARDGWPLAASKATVEYLHRSAAEWLTQPAVMQRLKLDSSPSLDPNRCLFQAHAKLVHARWKAELTARVDNVAYHCSRIDYSTTPSSFLKTVDQFFYSRPRALNPEEEREIVYKLSAYANLHYFQYKLDDEHGRRCTETWPSLSSDILYRAIVGPGYDIAATSPGPDTPTIFNKQRLELVEYLAAKGFKLNKKCLDRVRIAFHKQSYAEQEEIPPEYVERVENILNSKAKIDKRGLQMYSDKEGRDGVLRRLKQRVFRPRS